MKKLNFVLTVMMCFCVWLTRGQEIPFRVVFSVTEASCYNNGRIVYALTDADGTVLEALPGSLSQVRAYYKLSASDSAHYAGWYYTGGTDTLTVNSGNYIVGVEGLLSDGNGGFVRVDTQALIVVGTSYQKPEASALYLFPRLQEEAGGLPSLSCLNTGRVQLKIERGRFPYTVTVCDHTTGDTLRTTVFEDRQFSGTNPALSSYRDYYSFDSLPAGNWDFYLVDGCGYGFPRINQQVNVVQLPKMKEVYLFSSSGDLNDSNIVKVGVSLDQDASIYEEQLEQYVRYRFLYAGLMEGEWKKLPADGTLMKVLYDTVGNAGSYCDIMDRDITLEYKITLCEDTVISRTFQYNRPNPIFFQKDLSNVHDSTAPNGDPCVNYMFWHRSSYSIRYYSNDYSEGVYNLYNIKEKKDHDYYRYHYTHPIAWEYTDIRNGNVIKRDTVGTIVDYSFLYGSEVEAIYGSYRDTAVTIPVERRLVDSKGCELFSTIDTMVFLHCQSAVSNCWELTKTGTDYCCQDYRQVRVHATSRPRVDPDGTIVRLVRSPYNNRYNFEAVYHSDTKSWNVVKASVENVAIVSGDIDGYSLVLKDYCLPSGPYVFEIITPCDSFTVSGQISFPGIIRTRIDEEPSYTITRECANQYVTYTHGAFTRVTSNTSPETGLPLEDETQPFTVVVEMVRGPLESYSTTRFSLNRPIRISMPGIYVFKVGPNPFSNNCDAPAYYDTIDFNETTVEFEYAMALLCDSSSTSGNAFVLGSNGVQPYTYTLYDHPDKQGDVLGVNHTGVFMDVPMRSDQELSCLVEDSCHAYFHVNFYPRALADLQKVWFDGGLTVMSACEGSTIQVHALSIGDVLQYVWSGPGDFQATSSDPYVFVPRDASDGWYKVVIYNNSCSEILTDSIYLLTQTAPSVTLEQDTLVCPGQPVELRFTPHSPLGDSVVTFTIAFVNDDGVTTRSYASQTGVSVTDTFVTMTDAMIYPVRVSDGRCDYVLTDPGDTIFVRVVTEEPYVCTIQTTNDRVCHGGNARLLARSSMEPPYTLRWFGDYELSHLLKTDLIQDTAIWSYYDTNGIVQRTILYATVEREGMCPPVNGLYTNVMAMQDGITMLACGENIRLFDSGGSDSNYLPNEQLLHRFVSSDGRPISIMFSEMELSPTAHLLVFSGGGLSLDSLLYDFTAGMDNPGMLISNSDTLTLYFMSGKITAAGWSAVVGPAAGVAIADVWRRNTVFLYDEVCQSQSSGYDDPYGVAPRVVSSEVLDQAVHRAGTYCFTKTFEGEAEHGCDSMVTFTLKVNLPYTKDTIVIVQSTDSDGFIWYGTSYTESGHYARLMNLSGSCDSLEILHLVLLNVDITDGKMCQGDTIQLQVSVSEPDDFVQDNLIPAAVNVGDVLCDDGAVVGCDALSGSGKVPKGVVFFVDNTGQHGLALALTSFACPFASQKLQYPSVPSVSSFSDAVTDLDGRDNTFRLRQQSSEVGNHQFSSVAAAAYQCYYYDHRAFSTGYEPTGWYLPAVGEWNLLYDNVLEVNKTLQTLHNSNNAVQPLQNGNHWTSTVRGSGQAWTFSTNGMISRADMDVTHIVRAVIAF